MRNKKGGKRGKVRISFAILILLVISMSLASASFEVGNGSEIETEYGAGEFLRGQINISLQNEPVASVFSCFNSNITVLNFLENSGKDYECIPYDCEDYYTAQSGESSKSFSLSKRGEKIIGLRFQGVLRDNPIQDISFRISSDAATGCSQPLRMDILNNGEEEWMFSSAADDFICSYSTGCFDSSGSVSDNNMIGKTPYCQRIKVPPQPDFEIGAYVINGTTPNPEFTMEVYDIELGKLGECVLPAISSPGEESCVVSLNLKQVEGIFVCISADVVTDYKIRSETTDPCGFYGLDSEDFTADYHIFAKGSKYDSVGSFVFDEAEFQKHNPGTLKGYLEGYLYDRFDNNCENECTVPIKLISGIEQGITLSNLQLSYDTTSGLKSENNFYDVGEEKAGIITDFIKLDLKYANFSIPSSDGSYPARIYLNQDLVIQEDISVYASVNIVKLNAEEVPAAAPYKFIVNVSGGSVASYKWDFGDGSIETTTKNEIIHTYPNVGNYNLKIEATDSSGSKAIKNFPIRVVNPKQFIKISLDSKIKDLNSTRKDLGTITGWYKREIEKIAGLDKLGEELADLERRYNAASTTTEYVGIMSDLQKVEVPYSLQVHQSVGEFFLGTRHVNPSYLLRLGFRADNLEGYKEAIVGWFSEYIEVNIESNTPYLYYAGEQVPILTALKLKIKPKKDFSKESYLIIDESYDKITFKESYNEKAVGDATAITFPEFQESEEKIVEFILEGKIDILETPIYISPEFSQLPVNISISMCDHDGICEKNLGETAENCLSDCRSWKKTIIYLSILFAIAFAVYIFLQEWYKRYYEKHLFKNKNDLFNLINFINNALNQKMDKKEITKKLKASGWDVEQVVYAFKKLQGKRTGMWEIPIFRIFEKRKIKKELEKRQREGMRYFPRQSYKSRKI